MIAQHWVSVCAEICYLPVLCDHLLLICCKHDVHPSFIDNVLFI